jgi:hypothetical protein
MVRAIVPVMARVIKGAAMHRPGQPGYGTGDSFVIDDWRPTWRW